MRKLGSFCIFAVSGVALAQQQNPYSLSTQTNLVTVPVQVASPEGAVIYDLTGSQFVVTDNGVPQKARLEEAPEQTGLSLAVVVQCSGAAGMEWSKLTGLGAMIEAVVGSAPHTVAVISYGTLPAMVGDFTSDLHSVQNAIAAIRPCDGKVATLDAVEYANQMLEDQPNHYRRAILLVSETRDHGSQATPKHVIEELGRTNTVVNTVAYSPARDQVLAQLKSDSGGSGAMQLLPLLMMAVNGMRNNAASELATLSGGEYLNFTTRKGFDQALGHLANQLHNFYLLSFQPPNNAAAGYHHLRVSIASHPEYLVRNRTSYWFEPAAPTANAR